MRRMAALAVCLACVSCGVYPPRGRVAGAQWSAACSCVSILSAQATFHKTDHYKKGERVYANSRDGAGLYDLYELPDGTRVGLIDKSLAESIDGRGKPRSGYFIATLSRSADAGPYDPRVEFAMCTMPSSYKQSGTLIFIMDTGGTVYEIDAGEVYPGLKKGDRVMPLAEYPSAAELKARWKAVGNE